MELQVSTAEMNIDTLTDDAFVNFVGFLVGRDLFSLSHVSSALLNERLACDSLIWKKRVPPPDGANPVSAKERYLTRRSYCLPGTSYDGQMSNYSRSAIELPRSIQHVGGHKSFSLSIVFTMDPPSTDARNAYMGGTLLGGQSGVFDESPRTYHRFIHIDTQGSLYCSIVPATNGSAVAKNLEPHRWYHVVLTFEQSTGRDSIQCVYLDGKLLQLLPVRAGAFDRNWFYADRWQLGSGFEGHDSPSLWSGFRGRIDEFSLRPRVLSAEEIQGSSTCGHVHEDKIWWSLQRDGKNDARLYGNVSRVHCFE